MQNVDRLLGVHSGVAIIKVNTPSTDNTSLIYENQAGSFIFSFFMSFVNFRIGMIT